jgi:transposase-like protein
MNTPYQMPRLKGFRFAREIIAYAVWAYHRFALSTADVEDLLAQRGVIVSREAIRLWVNRFGRHFADCVRPDRPAPRDKWHVDEVVITIHGTKHWLWRAIDADGNMLDILVQPRRNATAARRFLRGLITRFGMPRVVVTDKLRSYIKPIRTPGGGRRASDPQRTQQRGRSLAQADPKAGDDIRAVQVTPTSTEIPCCPRPDQPDLPLPPPQNQCRVLPPRQGGCVCPLA